MPKTPVPTNMPIHTQLIIAYPASDPVTGEPLKFNMEHYTKQHLALATRLWGPSGLKSWSVVEFANPNPFSGETPPYLFQATGHWDVPPEAVLKAVMESRAELGPDVVNFTNVTPVLWVAKAGASGTVDGGQ